MKSLVILMISLLMSSAFAGRPSVNDSWEELKSNYSLNIKWPSALMNHGPRTGVDFLCLDGEQIRTKKELTKCLKYKMVRRGDDHEMVCVESKKEFGFVDAEQTYTRCVKWQRRGGDHDDVCKKYEDYTYVQPLEFTVEVHKYEGSRSDRDRTRLLFKKDYSISACE